MWINRQVYDDLRLTAAQTQGQLTTLEREISALHTTLDWMRVRVTQLEKERAQLLFNYTGVKVETPRIEQAPTQDMQNLMQTVSFDDMGEEAAKAQGIGWDEYGQLTYGRK